MTGYCRRLGVNSILKAGPGTYRVFLVFILISAVLAVVSRFLMKPMNQWVEDCYEFLANGNVRLPYPPQGSRMSLLLALLITMMYRTVEVGWTGSALSISRGGEFSCHDLSTSFSHFWKVAVIHIIRSLALSAAAMLLLFPAVWLFYRWRLAYYVLLDNPKYGPVKCLKTSARLMDGHKKELFEIDLSFFASYLIALAARVISSGVIDLFRMPAIAVTMACYYNTRVGVAMPAEKMPPPPGYPEEFFGDGQESQEEQDGNDGNE